MTKSVFTDEYSVLLKTLILVRKKAGITQVELAKKLKQPQSYISKYEHGERRLDVIEFVEIVNALGASPVDVFLSFISEISN